MSPIYKQTQQTWECIATSSFLSLLGKLSTGFMQATPGEIKSLRSSGERMALIFTDMMLCATRSSSSALGFLPS